MPDSVTLGDGRLKILVVVGNSMMPELMPGQRIEYDTYDVIPSPPGLFVIWDGLSLVCQRVEYIPHSHPAMVRVSPANPAFQAHVVALDQLRICGRVVSALHLI